MKKALLIAVVIVCVATVTACSPDSDSKEALASMFVPVDVKPLTLNEEGYDRFDEKIVDFIGKELERDEAVYDAMVVQNENEILVAYKVHQLKRFNMEKIEADLNNRLEEEFPKYDFYVTSDTKIFLEAVELAVHVNQEGYPKEKAKIWFDKIVELEKEQT